MGFGISMMDAETRVGGRALKIHGGWGRAAFTASGLWFRKHFEATQPSSLLEQAVPTRNSPRVPEHSLLLSAPGARLGHGPARGPAAGESRS